MKNTPDLKRVMLIVNAAVIAAVFALNYVYQKNGFDFTLKCVCSGGFALLGIANFAYALYAKLSDRSFYIGMAVGLTLAMLGDVLIGYNFIVGAATFALGHISLLIAYCALRPLGRLALIISLALFAGGAGFLLFCPWLTFDEPIFKAVCLVYAVIISFMLGKALANFIEDRRPYTAVIAVASALFFFSDLMLVLDWFIGKWDWTDNACMGTYYPALCLLALSMMLKAIDTRKE